MAHTRPHTPLTGTCRRLVNVVMVPSTRRACGSNGGSSVGRQLVPSMRGACGSNGGSSSPTATHSALVPSTPSLTSSSLSSSLSSSSSSSSSLTSSAAAAVPTTVTGSSAPALPPHRGSSLSSYATTSVFVVTEMVLLTSFDKPSRVGPGDVTLVQCFPTTATSGSGAAPPSSQGPTAAPPSSSSPPACLEFAVPGRLARLLVLQEANR